MCLHVQGVRVHMCVRVCASVCVCVPVYQCVCVPVYQCVCVPVSSYVCACERAIHVHQTHREREILMVVVTDLLTVVNYNQIISDNGVISLPQKQNCSKKPFELGHTSISMFLQNV